MQSTLVLNASHEPLTVVPASRAITLLLQGKAVSLDDSERTFRSAHSEIPVPYVIRLNYMVKRGARKVSFSRRGVLVRDRFTCVYCKGYANTIDHVKPQSKGGLSTYDNCVAACRRCNSKKDDKSLEEMGWTLNMRPYVPSWYMMAFNKAPANSEQRRVWGEHIALFDPKVALMLAE